MSPSPRTSPSSHHTPPPALQAGASNEGKSTLANAFLHRHFDESRNHSPAVGSDSLPPARFPISHEVDGVSSEVDTEGVWMWVAPATSALPSDASAEGSGGEERCRTMVVLDSSEGGSTVGGWSRRSAEANELARRRLLAFLVTSSSRLVLNAARQPSEAVLERLGRAAAAHYGWQQEWSSAAVADGAHNLLQLPAHRTAQPVAGAIAPPTPPAGDASTDALSTSVHAPPADDAIGREVMPAGAWPGEVLPPPIAPTPLEVVVLIRDAMLGLKDKNGTLLSEQQVLERWFNAADAPVPSVLRTAFPLRSLLQLVRPSPTRTVLTAHRCYHPHRSRTLAAHSQHSSSTIATLTPCPPIFPFRGPPPISS